MKRNLTKRFVLCYADGDDAAAAAEAKAAADKAAADKTAADKAAQKLLTQDEVNAIVAKERRESEAKTASHIKELETLKKSQSMSEKDRQQLQARIDEMQNSLLTKEQLAAKERERLETQHKQSQESLKAERDVWQNRFHKSTINTAIVSEASRAEAFDPEGLIALLAPDTRLVEETDSDGKGTDNFVPKIKFKDTDSEGKPVALDLTVPETIKRMKEVPRFAYLFKSTAVGGLGAAAPVNSGGRPDVSKMSPAQYREHRKKNGLARKPGMN